MMTLAQTLKQLVKAARSDPAVPNHKLMKNYRQRIIFEIFSVAEKRHQLARYLGIKTSKAQPDGNLR